MTILTFSLGLIMLLAGAELLVRGASKIAAAMGISPLVIGLTVVAFGTSSPELVISVTSALEGQPGIALGNVLGSNIFNVLFILGLAAIIIPLVVDRQLIRLDVPVMIVASLTVLLFSWNGHLAWWEGAVLIAGGVVYIFWLIRQSRKEPNGSLAPDEPAVETPVAKNTPLQVLFVLAGLALLITGSNFLINSAVEIASQLGVSDLIIGLTIIAAGTSLPEIATSVLAGIRGQRDIAVGNVVGSNIFNLLFILGATSVVSADGIPVPASAIQFDIPVMVAVAVACMPIFFTGRKLSRWEGFVFFGYYILYTTFLVLSVQRSELLGNFTIAMVWFVFPLTIMTLLILVYRESKKVPGA